MTSLNTSVDVPARSLPTSCVHPSDFTAPEMYICCIKLSSVEVEGTAATSETIGLEVCLAFLFFSSKRH